MRGINEFNIMGNLGGEPEVKTFENGDVMAVLNVATSEKWNDKKSGDLKQSTDWHRITCYGRNAEIARDYLKKGNPVHVTGAIKPKSWEENGQKRYGIELRCKRLILIPTVNNQNGVNNSVVNSQNTNINNSFNNN